MTTRVGNVPVSSTQKPRAYVGPLLILVCALHVAVGVVDAAAMLNEAAQEGWAGAFTGERVVMWFLMTGVVGLVAGVAVTVLERSGRTPWTVSLMLLLAAGVGVSMAPTSGFVLVLAVAILAILRSAHTA